MVNPNKVKKKLPGLLINDVTGGFDSKYQKKRKQIGYLQREPSKFEGLFNNVMKALDALDREAEKAGFGHYYIDDKGHIRVRHVKR